MTDLPARSEVVVVGGGAVGLSTAFHLAEAGVGVTLLERDELGEGSTSKAAGGVRAQFSDPVNIQLGLRSLRQFERFHSRPGGQIDLKQYGYLFLLSAADGVEAFESHVQLQNDLGVPSRMLTPAQACELSPLVVPDGLLAAAYSPTDGHCTPEAVVQGYAGAARAHGAVIRRHCRVTGIETDTGGITAVHTESGSIATSTVVCAAEAWSSAVGEMAGRPAAGHAGAQADPRDRADPRPAAAHAVHDRFRDQLLLPRRGPRPAGGDVRPRRDQRVHPHHGRPMAGPPLRGGGPPRPRLFDTGLAHTWAGLYEITPDHNALIGETEQVSRFLYATGFSGHGFLQAPAVGETMRDLVLGHRPGVDVSGLHARRFDHADIRPERNLV